MRIKAVRSYATAARAAEQAGELVLASAQAASLHVQADAMEHGEDLAHAC